MQMTFRWFGDKLDTVSLNQIKQIPGVVGVVPALHDLPAGEAWTMDRVQAMYDEITAAGLSMECIESVNVHEDIKIGLQGISISRITKHQSEICQKSALK